MGAGQSSVNQDPAFVAQGDVKTTANNTRPGSRSSKMAKKQKDVVPPPQPPPLPPPQPPAQSDLPPSSTQPPTPSRSRRGSFSFLRRSKSREDTSVKRNTSSRLTKGRSRRQSIDQASVEDQVPRLPAQLLPQLGNNSGLTPASAVNTAKPATSSSGGGGGGENGGLTSHPTAIQYPPSSYSATSASYVPNAFYQRHAMSSQSAAAPMPGGMSGDLHARTESMTNRGRYSYGSYASSLPGSVTGPRRMRRRRDPTPFNILVLGTKNSGKTAFIDFLRRSLANPMKQRYPPTSPPQSPSARQDINPSFSSHYLETELDGERIGLTLYDSKGLERHIVDLQLREISSFLESKFQETFNEEQKVLRATGVRDTHIHCVFLILDPLRLDTNIAAAKGLGTADRSSDPSRIIGGLDERLDVNLIQTLQGKTTVIPVISKADTITTAHMSALKRIVWDSFKKIKFDPLEVLNAEDDESDYATAASSAVHDTDDEDALSSTYGESHNGDVIDKLVDKTSSQTNLTTPTVKIDGADDEPVPSLAPRHPDIRHSTMSDNVDLPYLPLSIISPDVFEPGVVGRRFPWGFADPYNSDHCDFVKLKDNVFSEWRAELREAARERWYENWRTSRLKRRGHQTANPAATTRAVIGGRSVSGAAAYTGGAAAGTGIPPPRNFSTNQIGVAVSNDAQMPSAAGRQQYQQQQRGF